MSQSKQTGYYALANRLRKLIQVNSRPNACKIVANDNAIQLFKGAAGMIPHVVIVLAYRFAMAHGLLMYIDTDNPCLVLH